MVDVMILQLNPTIPVVVTSKNNGKGRAIGWIDYSEDHHIYWIVAMDENGEVWTMPNTQIRMQENWSLECVHQKK